MSAIAVSAVIFTLNVQVLANPLTDKLSRQKELLQEQQSSLQQTQKDRQALENKAEILDSQIETMMNQLNDIKKQINSTGIQIKYAENDIKKSEDQIDSEQQLFDKRMRAMYINGMDSYIEVILQSKSFSDLISNVDTVKRLIDFDKNLIADMQAKKQ